MRDKSLTIIIPNFNGNKLLQKNLPSVLDAAHFYASNTQVLIVDDGSKDGSVEMLKEKFPQVKVIIHQQNQGFAEAIHTGVNAAETELLFLLNSDVEVQKEIFPSLVKYFDDPNTFSVNPLIYDEQGQVKRHSWNLRKLRFGTLKLMPWTLEQANTIRANGKKIATLYAHGGSFLVRRSMFLALGGFHPIFKPFYSEDYDLGVRAWRRGWASYFEPSVHIVHQSLGSIRLSEKTDHIKSIRRRNRYLFEWLHFSVINLFLKVVPMTVLQLLGEAITFDKVNLKGFLFALKKLKECWKSRNHIIKESQFTIEEVLKTYFSN